MTSCFCTRRFLLAILVALVIGSVPAAAQLSNGSISGQITDEQGGALPGVFVSATQVDTGFNRSIPTDASGFYRLAGLPVGKYKLKTTISGFSPVESDVVVNVSVNLTLNLKLVLQKVDESILVEAQAPRPSGLQHVADLFRIESLPLNGRQLADIAGTLPGVGMGLHSDTSKSAQHTPQISGGNGRNLNWMLDGGDNNDDTVGGLAMGFPLEAVQEFSLLSQRFDAEYSRGTAVLNVVGKSGGNNMSGSWFTQMRDDALNSRTFREQNGTKQPYERYQYGGSVGGPIVRNKAHFFVAFERTQQDTQQIVNTNNTLEGDGAYAVPYRQNLFTGKLTASPNRAHLLAVRFSTDYNSQPSGVAANTAYSTWANSQNHYQSANVNHNWNTGGSSLNEFVFQYSNYQNDTPATATGLPAYTLASGAKGGANANAPQTTEQTRWQFRDDYSFSSTIAGRSHEFRAGVNILHTPRLFISNSGGTDGIATLATNDLDGRVNSLILIGGDVESNIPLDLYGVYVQDDWRVSNRLTLNLGVRWDYLAGMPIEQTSTNFANMQAAGLTGRFDNTLLQDFGKSPRGDWDNIQPRFGGVFDLRGDGRDLIRGGWGIYTDFAYTNANVLTASLEGGGIIFNDQCLTSSAPSSWCDPARGIIYSDQFVNGVPKLYTVRESAKTLPLPLLTPTTGEVVSPRLQQPFSYQTNIGWSHEVGKALTLGADYVRVDGRNLNMRMRPNVDTDPSSATVRYLAGVGVSPNNSSFKTALSGGRSQYDALIISGRKRMSNNFDLDASYTLAKATSDVGTASDELTQNLLQDINNPFSAFQLGPSTRVDARHRVTASTVVRAPYGIQVASILSFHSAFAATTLEGPDTNLDSVANDHTPLAYKFAGLNDDGTAVIEEAGACKTVNCSRRAPFSQVDLRVSRSFRISGKMRIEAMAEVFNVFNAVNPFVPLSSTRLMNVQNQWVPNQAFMQPTAYAGDAGQGDQRIAQLGFRLTF